MLNFEEKKNDTTQSILSQKIFIWLIKVSMAWLDKVTGY